jgi:RimJ/RimL family protein N-acetyltransferase
MAPWNDARRLHARGVSESRDEHQPSGGSRRREVPTWANRHAASWRDGIPEFIGSRGTVRSARLADAPALLTMLATPEVGRFITPPPTTIEGFERFIAWSDREQAAGRSLSLVVVPHQLLSAVGLFQLRALEPGFSAAEWGFAIGSAFWGSGLFVDAARLVVDFAFDTIGVHRLEARAAIANGRGHGALRKLGAVREGVLRSSLLRGGQYLDQILWTILDSDWRAAGISRGSRPTPLPKDA